jgi:murein DD-endopeptidase MepM/ murein hydrolase activator NlpD
MKFTKPYKSANKNQISCPFGAIDLAHKVGHTGTDFYSSYGTFLVAPEDVLIENIVDGKTITTTYDELRKGYGICMISQESSGVMHLFWHCLPVFPVKIGQIVRRGEIVAQMGNSGLVYSGGAFVPLEERTKTKKGTHLHWEVFKVNSKGTRDYFDCVPWIDWNLPVNYNIITAIRNILLTMKNIFK